MSDVYRQTLPEVGANALRQLATYYSQRYPFLLTSVAGARGAHDLLLLGDAATLSLHHDGTDFELRGQGDAQQYSTGNDFCSALDCWFAAEANAERDIENYPSALFIGGWFLYLSYELAAQLEPTLRLPIDTSQPLAVASRSRAAIVLPHDADKPAELVAEHPLPDLVQQVRADLAALGELSAADRVCEPTHDDPEFSVTDADAFTAAVVAAKAAIAAGDVYQANLSREWRTSMDASQTGALFDALCDANPSPFAALAHLDGLQIMSSSPERLVRVTNGQITTRPIAGTRPRGANADEDQQLVAELLAHPKERAEHVMLIDLERNDLGRICVPGSVHVDEYMGIETYRHVHHIVSNIAGTLAPGTTPGAVLAAVFPGGTITGCPKVRCMQLIAELEARPRGAYTGSLGYLARNGNMDLNILIRTMTVAQGALRFSAGAGIVADSDPQAELAETGAKAQGMLRAVRSVMPCTG
ncbi:MAG: aminodeoxychorismate synthase component I [Pseudomonadota bacterium]